GVAQPDEWRHAAAANLRRCVNVREETDHRCLAARGQSARNRRGDVAVLVKPNVGTAYLAKLALELAKQGQLFCRAGIARGVRVGLGVDLDVAQEAVEQGFGATRSHQRFNWHQCLVRRKYRRWARKARRILTEAARSVQDT